MDVRSGVVFTAWNDFEFKGRTPVVWRRFYASDADRVGPLGRGWTTRYFASLEERGNRIWLKGDEGHEHGFTPPAEGAASTLEGHPWELRREGRGFRLYDRRRQERLRFRPTPDVPGRYALETLEDPAGHRLEFRNDAAGRPIEIEQPDHGRSLIFTYTAEGLIGQVDVRTPGRGSERLVGYAHDERHNLIAATDPVGGVVRYAYDERDRLHRETNPLGGTFHFEYDERDRCVRSWGDGGYLERRLEFDETERTTRVTDSQGHTTTYIFGRSGALEKKIDPAGHETRFVAVPEMQQVIDPTGAVTHREYDEWGLLVELVDAAGNTTTYTYDDRGRRTRLTDPAGNEWSWGYDDRGRLTSLGDPLGATWTFERADTGEIVREIDPEGRVTSRRHAPHFRWQEFSDSLGHFRCEYDARGRPVLTSNQSGVLRTFQWDAADRLVRRGFAGGAHVDLEYDAAGNLVRGRHLDGAVWTFEYDAWSHLTAATSPNGETYRMRYDTEGRRVAVINERGEEWLQRYGPDGRAVWRKYFDGRTERYAYDPRGHVIGIERSDGTILRRRYDEKGHLTEESVLSPAAASDGGEPSEEVLATYEHDWLGRITAAENAEARIEFRYDAANRLVAERQNEFELRYDYDRSGRLVKRVMVGMDDTAGGSVAFDRDDAGYIRVVSDGEGVLQKIDYDRTGRVSRRWMRGDFVEELSYDERGRTRTQRVSGPRADLHRRYEFDVADRLEEMEDGLRGRWRWTYDAQLQLTGCRRDQEQVERFEYGPGGQLLFHDDRTFEYEPGGLLVGVGESRFSYDDNGRLTRRERAGRRTSYRYDAKGRLSRVELPDGSVHRFGYDPLGRRVSEESPGGRTDFGWSHQQLAMVRRPDEDPVTMLISGSWHLGAQWVDGSAEHVVCSPLPAPLEVLRPSGGRVWAGTYSGYGALLEEESRADGRCEVRLPGQFHDRETGLYYNYQRYYDPGTGRYLTPDPIGLAGGLDLYDYPRDPINWMDPYGLSCANPRLVEENQQWGWQIHEHDDGSLTITADASRGFATPKPHGLRTTVQTGDLNAWNPPEAHLGKDGRVIVMEGTHRSAAASHGHEIPPDPDHPHLGGVPGRPGTMTYEYSPEFNDESEGVPLTDLECPPGYPHRW